MKGAAPFAQGCREIDLHEMFTWASGDGDPQRFRNRRSAGKRLTEAVVAAGIDAKTAMVLALPRGGVPVAYELAMALPAPLDILTVRKLGAPGHEELAMGAIASGGVSILNEDVIEALGVSRGELLGVIARELEELERREALYRDRRDRPVLAGATVILVDDGLATGASMLAAIAAVRARQPARIVVAAPVMSRQAAAACRNAGVDVVYCALDDDRGGIGAWYEDFSQVTDSEVRVLLKRANART
ncbi:MAG TPA: phosphoribosyltransferase family protein [Candidatus Baltobacteraceae bacterium]|nr:phosphoribosyltransferase family protein [Candidatus Baltobacteraceae bacterium]